MTSTSEVMSYKFVPFLQDQLFTCENVACRFHLLQCTTAQEQEDFVITLKNALFTGLAMRLAFITTSLLWKMVAPHKARKKYKVG